MNTKYTLETDSGYLPAPLVCKSIRFAKQATRELNPKTAIIKNKRGERIHEYTEGEGWFKTFQKNKTKIKMAWLYGRQCY